jgi:hypothetical protein
MFLKTWNSEGLGTIDLTFTLYEDGAVADSASFQLSENSQENLEFDLSYNRSSWEGKTKQYVAISVS